MTDLRIPIRPLAKPHESLLGLLLRASQENVVRPVWLLEAAGLQQEWMETLPFEPLRWGRLADALGRDVRDVEGVAYGPRGNGLNFLGHQVLADHISVSRRQVCPLCLRGDGDQPFHRAVWDLSLITVCPTHSCFLISHCPGCGSQLSWRAPGPGRCRCGFDLGDAEVQRLPEEEVRGIAALLDALQSSPIAQTGVAAQIGAGQLLPLVFLLGRAHAAMKAGKPLSLVQSHHHEMHLVLNEGWRICDDWPANFHQHLDQLRANQHRKYRYGLEKLFGKFPAMFRSHADRPFGRVALDALHDHAANIADMPTRSLPVISKRKQLGIDRYMDVRSASKRFQVCPQRFRDFAVEHGLALNPFGGSGHPLMVRKKVVEEIEPIFDDLVDQQGAAAVLGLNKRSFVALRDTGCLPPPSSNWAAKLKGEKAWSTAELCRWLASFQIERTTEPTITLRAAALRMSSLGIGIPDVIRMLVEGRLKVAKVGRSGVGFMAFHLRERAVTDLHSRLRSEVVTTLSVTQAASLLRINQQAAYDWVERGFLQAIEVDATCAEKGRRITPEAIEEFCDRYISAAEIHRLGRLGQSKKVALTLIERGVQAVSGPGVDGARQYLFRRAAVEEFITRHHPTTTA